VPRPDSAEARDAVLAASVLVALPSPTVLIDDDGTMLLADSAWDAMADAVGEGLLVRVGGNYFAMALAMKDDDGSPPLSARSSGSPGSTCRSTTSAGGFSSLSQLIALPVGVLEIDRSLVVGAEGRASQSATAIAAVVDLGRASGMRVLAEGVETAEQLATVTDQGCTFAQGYHIARPMPADQLAAWMVDRSAGRPPRPLLTDAAMTAGRARSRAQLL